MSKDKPMFYDQKMIGSEHIVVEHNEPSKAPRRGSTLEGRVRFLLQSKGYQAETNKIVLDHEIDVWAEDGEGRVVLVECKEYYDSGPVSSGQIRNFFGKVYDIEHNYGEDIYLSMFVSISGFTDAARSLCERLGILAVDDGALQTYEQSSEQIVPRSASLVDQTVLELRKRRDTLRQEVDRRNLVRQLARQVNDYTNTLQTKTLPSFLVPSAISSSFWYSSAKEIPFVGLNGVFKDFAAPLFPRLSYVLYEQRRWWGQKTMGIPMEPLYMQNGIIHFRSTDIRELAIASPADAYPGIEDLMGGVVVTLDDYELGTVADLLVTFKGGNWTVEAIKVQSSAALMQELNQPAFYLPCERVSLDELPDKWRLVAHVTLVSGTTSSIDFLG